MTETDDPSRSDVEYNLKPIPVIGPTLNLTGKERVDDLAHHFKLQRDFGAEGTLTQCRIAYSAHRELSRANLLQFCELVGVKETSLAFRFLLETGERYHQLEQTVPWPRDWLALYILCPPHDAADFARMLRIGKLIQGSSAGSIRDALAFAAYSENK